MGLIGISGKIGSGKDTVGKIIQYHTLRSLERLIWKTWKDYDTAIPSHHPMNEWRIKKFAYKLKQIVSILTGCKIEDLENQDFKNKQLGEEWNWYRQMRTNENGNIIFTRATPTEEAKKMLAFPNRIRPYTYREVLQRVGTEAMRDMIHEDIWINALFSEYRTNFEAKNAKEWGKDLQDKWIITDLRFPNELKSIENRNGITIRINREIGDRRCEDCYKQYKLRDKEKEPIPTKRFYQCPHCNSIKTVPLVIPSNHPSETSLDNANFKYSIDNNGTIEELVEKVKEILILEKII